MAKAKKKAATKKAATKAPTRKRAPKKVVAPPDPPNIEETPEEAAAAVIEDLEPEPVPVATVLCRYCGKEIPKPIGSTFFKCDECEGTGDPLNADQV
jgi:hypothetical protein